MSFTKKIAFLVLIVMGSVLTILVTTSETSPPKIRVALFHDKGANPRSILIEALQTAPDMTLTILDGEELREGDLNNFDLLLVPGGSAKKESMSMKLAGRNEVRQFVHRGGLYIGICAGAYLLTEAKDTDLGLLPLDTVDKKHWARGKGLLSVQLTPLGKEIFGTSQDILQILYHNGPVIDASHVTPQSHFQPLGYFRGEMVNKNGIHGLMVNKPAMFLGRYGKGLVIGISPHPEADPNQVQMELNAIRWLYSHRV